MPDRLPSINLLLRLVQGEREKQLTHFDALDAKAAAVLAFSGLLVTLAPQLPLAFRLAGVVAALVAAGFAVSAFWPRRYPILDPTALRKYLRAEEGFTQLTVLDTLEDMVNTGSDVLRVKGRSLRVALVALAFAALAFGTGTVVTAL